MALKMFGKAPLDRSGRRAASPGSSSVRGGAHLRTGRALARRRTVSLLAGALATALFAATALCADTVPAEQILRPGEVREHPGSRYTVTGTIDPLAFPDLTPADWPSGRDVLERRDRDELVADVLVADVLAQAYPAKVLSELLARPVEKDGFLVWGVVPVLGMNMIRTGTDAEARAQMWNIASVTKWFREGGLRALPLVGLREAPGVKTMVLIFADDWTERSEDERVQRAMSDRFITMPEANARDFAQAYDPRTGCSAVVYYFPEGEQIATAFVPMDSARYGDTEAQHSFARRCTWAGTWHALGFPFSPALARRYGADLYPIATAALEAINRCAQTPHPTEPIMVIEQLPERDCVARELLVELDRR